MPGPQFIKYFPHVISALKDLGNSGTPPEVRELIAEKLRLSEDELNETSRCIVAPLVLTTI